MFIRANNSTKSPLISAYFRRDLNKFKKLISNGENVNCICPSGESLINLIICGDDGLVDLEINKLFFNEMIKADVCLSAIGNERSLLINAIDKQHDPYYMKVLLDKNMDVNHLGERSDDIIKMKRLYFGL